MSIRFLSGVHVPHSKNTADSEPVRIPVPKSVTVPLSMHIGAPAKCTVKPGDKVFLGQVIGESSGFVCAPVHSPVSGTVSKITKLQQVSGAFCDAVIIESDGEQTPDPGIRPPEITDYQSFIDAVRASGAVGLGGAGFPTAVKLDVKDLSKIKTVIINGAECEPFITSDTRTMIDRRDDIAEGCRYIEKYLGVKNIVAAIENNKPLAIRSMKKLAESDKNVTVKVLPPVYPQGGEKVLIYNITGRMVPEGGLPLDVGCIVINCTTLAFLGSYFKTGVPLTEKCITVDGSAVKEPKNVIAPIGTPASLIFDFCGGFREEPEKFLMGGPMMGTAQYDIDAPVVKNTNALLAFGKKEAHIPETTACIRCGSCRSHCPIKLNPAAITRALKADDPEELMALKAGLCMECGCCAFICPAKQPLVQNNKMAKIRIKEYQAKQKEAKA